MSTCSFFSEFVGSILIYQRHIWSAVIFASCQ